MSMNIYSLNGHKVKLETLEAGHDWQKEIVKKHLVVGRIYTVDYTVVHNSNTEVYLQEFPGVEFNSVFFEDVKKQFKYDDRKHPHYFFYNRR